MPKLEGLSEKAKNCIYTVSDRLIANFNVEYDRFVENEKFDLYAFHKTDFHKSFLTRSTVYEGFSVFEHILLKVINKLDITSFEALKQMFLDARDIIVEPNKMHKKSIVIGIVVCEDEVSEEFKKVAKKFFCKKTYKMLFHGWSETTIAIYSLKTGIAYLPKSNKDLKNLFVDI